MLQLLDAPEIADRMGGEGRRWAIEHADVDRYAERIKLIIDDVRHDAGSDTRSPA